MANNEKSFYELYRTSSIGVALTDTLDELISNNQIEPQLAMKIIAHFDKAFTETISEKVRSKLSFKGHLDTYRFCDDVWTFLIKDVTFKLDNQNPLKADKVKIVSCTNKKAGNEPSSTPSSNKPSPTPSSGSSLQVPRRDVSGETLSRVERLRIHTNPMQDRAEMFQHGVSIRRDPEKYLRSISHNTQPSRQERFEMNLKSVSNGKSRN